MKSSGPWNLRGLRPEARETAREAARRSGISVGEWLNSIIQSDDGNDEPVEARNSDRDADDDANWRDRDRFNHGRRERDRGREPNSDRYQNGHDEPDSEWERDRHRKQSADRDRPRERDRNREQGGRDRERDRNREQMRAEQNRDAQQGREQQRGRDGQSNRERQPIGNQHNPVRDQELAYVRESAKTREELGALNGRLDELSRHLERLLRGDTAQRQPAPKLTGAPVPPHQIEKPAGRNGRSENSPELSIDDAVAEIAARQRVLDTMAPAAAEAVTDQYAPDGAALAETGGVPPVSAPLAPFIAGASPAFDVSGLERQLRDITARLEELRPSGELAKAIEAVRADLAEIAGQIKQAQPRCAVEPLETEIRALAARIDQSRECGANPNALAGLERSLAEMREALRGLATSETLAGFDETVKSLSQRLDLVATRDDPAALQQLEAAIGGLRGIVSHVASNDTLNKVAENVRSLAATVDAVSNSMVSGQALTALESRVESLAQAITTSTEAGYAVPRELEKLLSGLIGKLERVQLTHADQTAFGHLEDRIAALISRFDASDARLGHLEAIERGLADLLVHLERMRSANGSNVTPGSPAADSAIERQVAEIKQIERRTQDSLEAVQGTVEQVVDRLAVLESGMRLDSTDQAAPAKKPAATPATPPQPVAEPAPLTSAPITLATAPTTPQKEPAPQRAAVPRPIDPNLPPDHPLEPGSATGRSRPPASTAERIAASEAAIGATKPPVVPDPVNKSDFIAAARRAAQAAAATAPGSSASRSKIGAFNVALPKKLTERVRTLVVAGSAVLIALFSLHVATRLFENNETTPAPAASSKASPPAAAPSAADPAKPSAPDPTPLPSQGSAPNTIPSTAPNAKSGAAGGAIPARQSSLDPGTGQDDAVDTASSDPSAPMQLWASDITGSLPGHRPAATQGAAGAKDLPATIGGSALRAAAMAGDASAAYEVAIRFEEGHGVPKDDNEAVQWFERAAKQGLALAQFRLGGFYEKGIGVKKDLAAARDLYLAAANKGNAKAMHNLAVLYAEGADGPPDYRTAAQWFRKAADHGIADSQYNLGILCARGIGVDQSLAESYKWFALAANHGDQEATKKRDEVAAKLDAQSLTAARLAVRTWSAESQPEEAISVKTPPGGWDAPARAATKSRPSSPATKAAASAAKVD